MQLSVEHKQHIGLGTDQNAQQNAELSNRYESHADYWAYAVHENAQVKPKELNMLASKFKNSNMHWQLLFKAAKMGNPEAFDTVNHIASNPFENGRIGAIRFLVESYSNGTPGIPKDADNAREWQQVLHDLIPQAAARSGQIGFSE
jgi:hypothetical protein